MWLFFIYWPRCTICVQDLSPPTNQGLNSGPQAVKARSPKHRPTREVLPFGALRQSRQEARRSSQPPKIKHHCPLHPAPAQARIMPGLAPPRPTNASCPPGQEHPGPARNHPQQEASSSTHTITLQKSHLNHQSSLQNEKLTCVCVSVFDLRNK